MADLYTSLTQIKMALNGGTLPPMTPLSERARAVLDPEFTIGMGALMEDEQLGLRCPVRGCGEWHHSLSQHVRVHPDIRTSRRLRELLDIPRCAPLISAATRAKLQSRPLVASAKTFTKRVDPRRTPRANRRGALTIGQRNFRNTCEAQLRSRLHSLQVEMGRAVSRNDVAARLGHDVVGIMIRVYGSFNAAKASLDLEVLPIGSGTWRRARAEGGPYRREDILEALRNWVSAHGELPSSYDAKARSRAPLLPSYNAVTRAMGNCATWDEAMRRAAALLDIKGGRWGLPPDRDVA